MSLLTGSLIMMGIFGLGVYTGLRLARAGREIDIMVAQALDRRTHPVPTPSTPTTDWVYDEWWKN